MSGFGLCDPLDIMASLPDLFVCRKCQVLTVDPHGHTAWHGTVDSTDDSYLPGRPDVTVLDKGRSYVAAGLTYCAECNARLSRGHAPGCSLDKVTR